MISSGGKYPIEWLRVFYSFTVQEWRQLREIERDLEMWGGRAFEDLWREAEESVPAHIEGSARGKRVFKKVRGTFQEIRGTPPEYPSAGPAFLPRRLPLKTAVRASLKKVDGLCPVASSGTLCCNLRTIDAVENCPLGCSYCTIQTFYGKNAVFDAGLKTKLRSIRLDPGRFYHFGTGQSSDSLAWGNRNNVLGDLCDFAEANPNVLLEFKTKTANIDYFLSREVPRNIVLSWSLNPETVISNEEHFTASLEARLAAARRSANAGIPVAFHIHPMFVYEGWERGYGELADAVRALFQPEETAFLSFGAMTFIKPVIRSIRERGGESKVLRMNLTPAPGGKISYPEEIKVLLFRRMKEAFEDWRGRVFTYLCMEPRAVWEKTFGWSYPSNEEFEEAFTMSFFLRFPAR